MALTSTRVCGPSEGHQPTALAEGGRGRGEVGSTRPAFETILRRPVILATRRIYNIVTLRPKYSMLSPDPQKICNTVPLNHPHELHTVMILMAFFYLNRT